MRNRNLQILGHFLFWVIIVFTYALSEFGYSHSFADAFLYEILFLPVRLVAVYLNWFLLLPGILYKNKVVQYLLILGLILFVLAFAQRVFILYWGLPTFFPQSVATAAPLFSLIRIFQSLVIIAAPVAFSTGIRVYLDWNQQKNRSQQLQKEKLDAELKYLRAQVNPHFLFNTLNNLYGLSREQSPKVPGLILKLSDFLSYSLYESQQSESNLKKEISLVNDYIDLEMSRFGERIELSKRFPDQVDAKIKVPSFLLIPLVENAFKHGAKEERGRAKIQMDLEIEKALLVFSIINTVPKNEYIVNTSSGIGLSNLRRRLEILYENRHELTTQRTENQYFVKLKLMLR